MLRPANVSRDIKYFIILFIHSFKNSLIHARNISQ